MINWIPKNKIVGFASGVLLISILLYLTGLFIVDKKIKEIENTESESSKEDRKLALKSLIQINRGEVQTLRDFFIKKGDEVKFIERIEEVARKNSVQFEINSIDVKGKDADSFKEDITVKMNISGSWANLIGFLDMLNKMSFGVSIQNLDLDVNSLGGWAGSINFIIFREK